MTANDSIKRAIDMIGEGKADDYVIFPVSHAKQFGGKAPDLAAILKSSEVIALAEKYEKENKDALETQNRFKCTFSGANITVLITSILIAFILATGTVAPFLPPSLNKPLLVVFCLGSIVTGALASRYLFLIKEGHLLEDWMTRRASAETNRLDYFGAIITSSASSTVHVGVSVELLKLEYFRRFQLDVQRAYYRVRGENHREEAAKTLSYSSWAAVGATIATGFAGVLGVIDARFLIIAATGSIFTGISSFTAMREAVHQDRRNSERYERTSRVLDDLYKRLDDVRKAVYLSGTKPLRDFVEAVHEQLSLEHRQWLGEMSETRGAFAKLEETLQKMSSDSSPKGK